MKRMTTVVVLVLACGLAWVGCARKQPVKVAPAPVAKVDPYANMSELRRKAAELTAMTSELPGDRQQFAGAFGKTSQALELLGGAEPTGSFRQQLRIIDNTRTTLAGNADVSDIPVTDSGLRAVQNALTSVSDRLFPGDATVGAQMDQLRDRVSELDTVRGALHGAVAAQAFSSVASVIDTMAIALDTRASVTPASAMQTN